VALEYWDGFDDYLATQIVRYFTAVYTGVGSTVQTSANNVSNVAGAYGGQAILTSSGAPGLAPKGGNQVTRTVGARYQTTGVISSSVGLTTWVDGTTIQVSIVVNANGTISCYKGSTFGTLLGTSAQVLSAGAWYYIETSVTINSSTGSIKVNVAGANWLNITGVNTNNSGNNWTNLVCLGSMGAGGNIIIDDLYIRSDGTLMGDQRVQTIYPNGVGAMAQFTRGGSTINAQNYQQVNEATPDDDTTYVYTPVAGIGNVDTYTYPAIATTTGTVAGVMVCPMMKNDAGGVVSGQAVYRIGTTNYFGATSSLGASYLGYPDLSTVNPATSLAWTISDVNSAQFGITRTA